MVAVRDEVGRQEPRVLSEHQLSTLVADPDVACLSIRVDSNVDDELRSHLLLLAADRAILATELQRDQWQAEPVAPADAVGRLLWAVGSPSSSSGTLDHVAPVDPVWFAQGVRAASDGSAQELLDLAIASSFSHEEARELAECASHPDGVAAALVLVHETGTRGAFPVAIAWMWSQDRIWMTTSSLADPTEGTLASVGPVDLWMTLVGALREAGWETWDRSRYPAQAGGTGSLRADQPNRSADALPGERA